MQKTVATIGSHGFLYLEGDFVEKNWGLRQDTSRNPQVHTVQLLIAFHRRRKTRLEVSIDLPFPAERRLEPPVNVIQQALTVRTFMLANPDETCLSAAPKLKLNRKHIAKLLQIIDALPNDFIEKAKEYTDPKVLHKMSANRLLEIANSEEDHF
jgi:hypothetical protein